MATASFPSFSRLPAEIRLMIWEAALPDPIKSPLYFWGRTDWQRTVDLGNVIEDDRSRFPRSYTFIHPCDMGYHEWGIPLLQVNQEAQRVVERWLQRQNLRLDPNRDPTTTVIRRPFCPTRDIVFCPDAQFESFMEEVHELFWALSEYGYFVSEHSNFISRVALPEEMLEDHPDWVSEIFCSIPTWCRNLYIVVNAPADLRQTASGPTFQQKWELEIVENLPHAEWCHDDEWMIVEDSPSSSSSSSSSASSSSLETRAYTRAKRLLKQIARCRFAAKSFGKWFCDNYVNDFSVHFARVARK
ncbi:hypothetical protein BP00DRAFT_473312 [Aspergillus indologenus CBS 114.80]|uniref:2EXR domain-containing protein n=1 Tax=Aspergillus indologenus CBS 114.80 TaxID=1450541 RepID=A0A2V5IDJ8_9EURO|nr:hypothetical protein BP00DRAFT_473312 [Aspergillus indologenus CBS 114.80]